MALPDWDRDGLARLVTIQLLLAAVALTAYYLGFFSGIGTRVPRLHFRRPRTIAWTSLLVVGGRGNGGGLRYGAEAEVFHFLLQLPRR